LHALLFFYLQRESQEKSDNVLTSRIAVRISGSPPQSAWEGNAHNYGESSSVTPSEARTRTTIDELMETLRKLEEEEKFAPSTRENQGSHHHDIISASINLKICVLSYTNFVINARRNDIMMMTSLILYDNNLFL